MGHSRKMLRSTVTVWVVVVLIAVTSGMGRAEQLGIRAGLEGLTWQDPSSIHDTERALIEGLKEPLLEAKNCEAALQHWFDGRKADAQGDKARALAEWEEGMAHLDGLEPVTPPTLGPLPAVNIRPLLRIEGKSMYLLSSFVVKWEIERMPHFGLFIVPESRPDQHAYPLLVYLADRRRGLSEEQIAWLARLSRKGYAVFAPALDGSRLLASDIDLAADRSFISSGDSSDLQSAAASVWAAVRACMTFPVVDGGSPAVIGVGKGGTVALLALDLAPSPTCTIIVDAWRINPFRFYWARMARGENRWENWGRFCSLPLPRQLREMVAQSPVHTISAVASDVLLIMSEEDRDTLNHQAHQDLLETLKQRQIGSVDVTLALTEGDVHDFVLQGRDHRGYETYRQLSRFLYRHAPPDDGMDEILDDQSQDDRENGGNRP